MISDNAGSIGLVEDIPGFSIPPEGWTTATNIRFNDGYAEKSLGHSTYATPSVAPYFLIPLQETQVFYWIYAGLTKIYITDGTNHYDASNGTYQVDADHEWTGDIFNGIPILNSVTGVPQALFPVSHSNSFVDLPNWPSNTYCSGIKGFSNFLISWDIWESGTRYPYKVKWSHQADPGSLPSSWDETDPTLDAGETNLSDKGGYLVDGGRLGDEFILYRENATYRIRYIGGKFIFSFIKGLGQSGIFSKRCFVEFEDAIGPKHCVLTDDDLIVHNGQTKQSIADGKTRDTLFSTLNSATNPTRAFLAHNIKKSEIWICYPKTTSSFCTEALIWNYKHNTFSKRALPGVMDIAFDVVDNVATSVIQDATEIINTATQLIDTRLYNPSKRDMLMADTQNTKLFKVDDTNQFNGTSFTATLQRTDLVLGGGKAGTSIENRGLVLGIRPMMTGTGPVSVRLGSQEYQNGTVTWKTAQNFTPGTDYKLDFKVDGRLFAVEFESTGDVDWRLHRWDFEIQRSSKN